ncbi:MAG: hypothetical protein JW940_14450 [Polyangiaceae bacterium]|nr:hypothetical protein [Polyangiaceae bacterium]
MTRAAQIPLEEVSTAICSVYSRLLAECPDLPRGTNRDETIAAALSTAFDRRPTCKEGSLAADLLALLMSLAMTHRFITFRQDPGVAAWEKARVEALEALFRTIPALTEALEALEREGDARLESLNLYPDVAACQLTPEDEAFYSIRVAVQAHAELVLKLARAATPYPQTTGQWRQFVSTACERLNARGLSYAETGAVFPGGSGYISKPALVRERARKRIDRAARRPAR